MYQSFPKDCTKFHKKTQTKTKQNKSTDEDGDHMVVASLE